MSGYLHGPQFVGRDVAIAEALSTSRPGEAVIVHEPSCARIAIVERRCTCRPLALTVGAEA